VISAKYIQLHPQAIRIILFLYFLTNPLLLFGTSISLKVFTCSQFHQHITSSFCADIFVPKNYKAKLLLEKNSEKHLSTKKAQVKC